MTAAGKAGTELSTETNSAAQDDVKVNLPSLPHQFSDESLLRMFESVKKEVDSEVPDVTTEDGRKRIKSLAAKISKSKTALDTPMRDYLRILKTQPKVLEASARDSKARFDQLRDELLAPLTEAQAWQDEHLGTLNYIPVWCSASPAPSAEELSSELKSVEAFAFDDIWPELLKKFKVAHEAATTTLTVTLERITLAEAQAARLEELEAEAESQRQKDHDSAIADAATVKARAEAEAEAIKQRQDVERRAVEATQSAEASKQETIKAKRDVELAEEKRKMDNFHSDALSINASIDADERQALAVKQAAQAEAKRIADEEAEQVKLAKARADDKDHRIKINRAALVDLIAAGVSEEDAKTVIRAIGRNEVRNIHITY